MRYLSPQDVTMRLSNTLVVYKGEPVFVVVCDNMRVVCKNLRTGEDSVIDANDEDLDVTSIPLGYINVMSSQGNRFNPRYLMRAPVRSQRQGINAGALMLFVLPAGETRRGMPNDKQHHMAFNEMFYNSYPTIDTCLQQHAGAFDRHWAVAKVAKRTWVLYYRTTAVGSININNQGRKNIIIPQGFLTKTRRMGLETCILNSGGPNAYDIIEAR